MNRSIPPEFEIENIIVSGTLSDLKRLVAQGVSLDTENDIGVITTIQNQDVEKLRYILQNVGVIYNSSAAIEAFNTRDPEIISLVISHLDQDSIPLSALNLSIL